jgi:SAM-dependent methyltransferase
VYRHLGSGASIGATRIDLRQRALSARQFLKKALFRWLDLWKRIEGAELEPPIWHSHFLSVRSLDRGLLPICRELSGRVLDIGAGTGFGRRFLDEEQTQYIPTDLRSARDSSDPLITRRGQKPEVLCSGYELPFRDCCFDVVMAHSLLEHVRRPEGILAEASRVLAQNGTLVISVPFCFPVHGFPDDFKRWTCEGLKLEVERVGFEAANAVPLGNSFYSLALNFNLLLRHQLPASSRLLYLLLSTISPLLIFLQLMTNSLALLLGPLDRSGSLPVAVGLQATKRRGGG